MIKGKEKNLLGRDYLGAHRADLLISSWFLPTILGIRHTHYINDNFTQGEIQPTLSDFQPMQDDVVHENFKKIRKSKKTQRRKLEF